MTSPSDPRPEEESWHEARPLPCPSCESTKGYSRVGKFRSQCLNCNSTFPNTEIGRENLEPQ